ncbi:zinc finger protein 239 [Drosophila pseudoobscura]|uniref:Zinc finger protein 239 n=1 Tax=Drosophila pseudoobscura pseudoobscura TaxID=46245 RepID=A0A6I8UQQ7_DROPS|nr:zinc finger protein 239 [Drosophila pseudoobscura]
MTLQCRACGGVIYNTNAKNLFQKKNSKLLLNIQLVSGILLINDPELPSCICAGCLHDLCQAIAFRNLCIETQENLLQNRSRSPTELATDYDEDTEIKHEIEMDNELAMSSGDLDDSFQNMDDLLEEFPDNDADDPPDKNIDEVVEDTAQDADTLITSLRKELDSIYDSSDDENGLNELIEFSDNNSNGRSSPTSIASNNVSPPPATKTKKRGRPKKVATAIPARRAKKQYTTWKNLTEEEIIERKRQQRRRDCVCEQCGRHFTDQSNFKLHMLRHTGIKNFACQDCGKKYYTDHLLSLHQRIVHRGEKPYTCKYCGKSFHNSTTRVIHERIHTNARPYACNYCNKCFSSASGRKRHELTHTDVRAFYCATCDQTFQRNTHLKAHLQSKIHVMRAKQKELD